MPLTPKERKDRLRRGSNRAIAKQANRHESHVSRVISGERDDPVVTAIVARRLRMSKPEAFPEFYGQPVGT